MTLATSLVALLVREYMVFLSGLAAGRRQSPSPTSADPGVNYVFRVYACVLSFVNHTHTPPPSFFGDSVVRGSW